MTRTQLQEQIQMLRDDYPGKVKSWGNYDAAEWFDTQALNLINTHVSQVIGEDDPEMYFCDRSSFVCRNEMRGKCQGHDEIFNQAGNNVRKEQRERAGLK